MRPPDGPNGYEQIYLDLQKRLRPCDFAEAAPRLGLEPWPGGGARVLFLNREYRIDASGVEPTDSGDADVNLRSVLARYVLSPGSGAPEGVFAPLSARGEGLHTGSASGLGWMNRPLCQWAHEDFAGFSAALARVGAYSLGEQGGYHLWHLPLLPRIPARVRHCAADEDFPCEVEILYDTGASRYLPFEPMAFLNGCVVDEMMRLQHNQKTTNTRCNKI